MSDVEMTSVEPTAVEAPITEHEIPDEDWSDVPDHIVAERKAEREKERVKKEKAKEKAKEKSSAQSDKSSDTTSDKQKESQEKDSAQSDKSSAQPEKKKLKIKGQELEVDEAKYHEYAQKGYASTVTWQEAARMKKDADDRTLRLKSDPLGVLDELGVDIDKIAEERVWDRIQKELDPVKYEENKRAAEKDKKAQAFDEIQTKAEREESERKQSENRARYAQELDKKIGDTLKVAKLPRSPRAAQRVVDYIEAAVRQGYQPDFNEVAENVRQELSDETKILLESSDPHTIKEFLGPNVFKVLFEDADAEFVIETLGPRAVEKIRTHLLSKFKATQTNKFSPPSNESKESPQGPKKLSGEAWRKQVMADYLGR